MPTLSEIDAELARRQQSQAPSMAAIDAELAKRGVPVEQPPQIQQLVPQESDFFGASVIEPALTMATGALAQPVSGLYGLGTTMVSGIDAGAEAVKSAQEAMTYLPKTTSGKASMQAIGETIQPVIEPLAKGQDIVNNYVFEKYGAGAATAVATAPTLALELIGLGALKNVRQGTKLIDETGMPTVELEKALDTQGLNFDSLSMQAQQSIPQYAEPKLLPSPKSETKGVAEIALFEQLKSKTATDDALAPLMIKGDKIKADKLAGETLKQGFSNGVVQTIKSATPETKALMREMTKLSQKIGKNERLALEFRPSNVVGKSLVKRINYLRSQTKAARIELDKIATVDLHKKTLNGQAIVQGLTESLNKYDVGLEQITGQIKPSPVFKESMIAKDRTSQRIIKDLVDLMAEGQPTALRAHKLKRQIDQMIDYRKKSAGGLTNAGKNVLKDIRTLLNKEINKISPDYERVNGVMHKSLTALDDFKDAASSKIDYFADNADAAIGQEMRKLMSNYASRQSLENAVLGLDNTVTDLGGKFGDNVKDLVFYSNVLDDRFGAVAKTSFKGQIASALKEGAIRPKEGIKEKVAEFGAKKAEQAMGIDDFNAYRSLFNLINRK